MQWLNGPSNNPPPDLVALIECLLDDDFQGARSELTPILTASAQPWMVLTTPQGDQLWFEQEIDRRILTRLHRIRELGLPLLFDRFAEPQALPEQRFRMRSREGKERIWGVTRAPQRTPLLSPLMVVPRHVTLWLNVSMGQGSSYLVQSAGELRCGGKHHAVSMRREGEQMQIVVEEHMCAEESIPVRICLGGLELSVAQLAAVRPGAQFEFSLPRELSVIVQCNGVDWALGNLTFGERGEVGALKITQQLYGNSDYSSGDSLHTGERHG